jgi:hypothetical protein
VSEKRVVDNETEAQIEIKLWRYLA